MKTLIATLIAAGTIGMVTVAHAGVYIPSCGWVLNPWGILVYVCG